MKASTPSGLKDPARRRSSVTGSHRTSMGSSLPLGVSRIAQARAKTTQPAYDFLTGGESTSRPPSRGAAFRQSLRAPSGENARPDGPTETDEEREKRRREMDELKMEVKTLKYTIDNHKQEEELAKLRFESELRDARRKGEEDFKKMQAADGEKNKAVRQYESLLKEMTEIRDAASNEKAALERRVREVEESKRVLEEEVEDSRFEREEHMRSVERRTAELESRNETLQRTVEELQHDSDQRETLLQETQQQLADKETAYGSLEADVLRLKAQTGDAETLGVIKRELGEQVAHIRKLEVLNREQAAELKHYKRLHKSVEVVEEEKRSLQRRLEAMEGLENDLGEARIQRQRLEDERLAWTAYLQSQDDGDGQLEFDSPEALARALVEERLQTATLVERLGGVEPELAAKDSTIQTLETEKANLAQQIETLKSAPAAAGVSGPASSKLQLRLERQRALAVKEAEYLRAQLKTYDTEDTTFQPESVDAAKVQRIQELEDMVEKYRQEVEAVNAELSTREAPPPITSPTGTKRRRDDSEESEQLGQLSRKNRKLQDDLTTYQNNVKILKKELSVTKERLQALSEQNKNRVLSLRSNPTADFEAIKLTTLTTLRQENADLLAQLRTSQPTLNTVPHSALEAAEQQIVAANLALASEKKSSDRRMKVWSAKTVEFRQLVISLLGWDVVFLKDGKMRVTSSFYPSVGEHENSIVFDGERGTMKISGGPESAFAVKIGDQIRFWVRERNSIPCFLAALTLEFYEESLRDGTLRVDV
ncbi:hypothetical protein VTL71DRAFT_9085 [Oculimacula yallundae]|uniref:Spindle assembly checkpoint component MAD1 n=1 Tax=Oculimacula yallundae TaxID=86028 RepID=A0ABR4BTQ7_9HELO